MEDPKMGDNFGATLIMFFSIVSTWGESFITKKI